MVASTSNYTDKSDPRTDGAATMGAIDAEPLEHHNLMWTFSGVALE
jgi:hypothetical protein